MTSDTFAKAAEGMLKQEGADVSYQACFAAGTLVHTDKGLVPIEQVRVGTRVLSQPELGGALDYRRVTDRIATLDQIVFAVQVKPERSDAPLMTLITTHGHPFWVETPAQNASSDTNGLALDKEMDKAKHWVAAEQLAAGQILQLADGTRALVRATGVVRKTQHADVGFVASNDAPTGIVLSLPTGPDLLNEPILPASAERLDALENAGPLQLAEPLKVTVYNLTVDEFHTYYVAELGVWVHNTYGVPEAVKTVFTIAEDRAAIKKGQSPNCFVAGTLVHTKEGLKPIEQIQVGDWVLSYPDDQQPPDKFREPHEYTYKRVLQTFVTENQPVTEFPVLNLATGNIERFTATPNHPIFVLNHGWMTLGAICALRKQVGVENYNFRNLMLGGLYKDKGLATVYNIEVEDFHTYYVGEEGMWVHNCDPHSTREINNVKELLDFVKTGEGKIEISRTENFKNENNTNSPAYSGRVGEKEMKFGIEVAIQKEVRTDLINASRNGPDGSVFIDAAQSPTGKALWIVPEAKASIRNSFLDPLKLAPTQKAIKWLYEGSGEAFTGAGVTRRRGHTRRRGQVLPFA